jgi:nicotinamidase-related amidase
MGICSKCHLAGGKPMRGGGSLRIGDEWRIVVRGSYDHDIIDELTPLPGEPVIDMQQRNSALSSQHESALSLSSALK